VVAGSGPRLIGLFGGSFDPPHMGHRLPVRVAAEELGLEKVIVMPAAAPPHKSAGPWAPPEARLRMTAAAFADDPLFETASDEIERGGISYTVLSLERLALQYPSPDFERFLLIGADLAGQFDTWRDPERIFELARVVVMVRRGSRDNVVVGPYRERMRFVATPQIDVSSSGIRSRVNAGLPIVPWVASAVADIIEREGLYR